jgi:hypothetical protein
MTTSASQARAKFQAGPVTATDALDAEYRIR